jgi:HSP20 family protein
LARDARAIASTNVDWVETPEAHVFRVDLPG